MKRLRIGIDLGGTKIEGMLIDSHGEPVSSLRRATPRGDYAATLRTLASVVAELDSRAGRSCPVGIGTPGSWVAERRAMKNCNSTWLNGRPLLDDLTRMLERPIRIANDANCFALSEALAGAGRNATVVFGVILGTGVGGGWVVRGELVGGANGVAGEWGHTPLPYLRDDPDSVHPELEGRLADRSCYCGRRNCVETFLSGPGLAATHRELWGHGSTAEQVAHAEDERSVATLDVYSSMLTRALAQMVNVMDPEVIVLGGGVSNVTRLYHDVTERMARYGFAHEGATRVVPAAHGDASGVRGAAWLNPP